MVESPILLPSRRGFIGGLLGLVAAPAVIRVTRLMPIRAEVEAELITRLDIGYGYLFARPEWTTLVLDIRNTQEYETVRVLQECAPLVQFAV